MSGSTIGKNFTVTTWGESHGKAIGVVVDGCPAGIPLSEEDIQKDLDRRRPGKSPYSTPRQEEDKVTILSGVFEGFTTGTPISLIIPNQDQRSKDYSQVAHIYRPGHADYTYHQKYGIWDYRGGGRASGRETAARVAAGAIAKKVLSQLGVEIQAYTLSIGPVKIDPQKFDKHEIYRNPFAMPDREAAEKAAEYIQKLKEKGDSAGGIVECIIQGLPSGVGEPVFDKLDAALAKAIMSIGAVKGIEFGRGFEAAYLTGSQNNDPLASNPDKGLIKLTNNSGGITGGISEGFPIVFRAAFKPTPSISIPQDTVTHDMQNTRLKLTGRHDPVIVPRAVVVVEAMAAITVVDLLFQRILSRIDLIKKALS
ncbi:chorismate synthase [Caldicoprobacter guelmensis]|uniref:chorismate synthase n=1 Tax=Caldicoprobacter guelmensis TaxID=1170224 RepID=UPI00195C1C7A|nr:chorismate synthase [Caldicoprobacter guelmensis]MBM7582540.1 chorismate synthase [Caldicoprobacter guelmensis]